MSDQATPMTPLDLLYAQCHLIDPDDSDAELVTLYALAAEQDCQAFIDGRVYPDQAALDAANDPLGQVVTPAFTLAVALLVGYRYDVRAAVTEKAQSEIPLGVGRLLWPLRKQVGV